MGRLQLMRLQMCAVAILTAVCTGSSAQTSTSKETTSSSPQPLLRIERVREGEAVCALVSNDGTYRLEKLVRAKGDMYMGTAGAEQVASLRTILADAQLRAISQEKIRGDLITDTIDGLDLAIWRDRGWQVLSFHNSSSRKPFKDSLDPLLTWFQELQKKRPAAREVPGPATRCVPPSELKARDETPELAARASEGSGVPSPSYLFRFHSSDFRGDSGRSMPIGKAETGCTIIYPDGTYHRERRTQSTDGSRGEHGYSGRVESESLIALKNLLESSELKSAVSDVGPPQEASQFEGISVWIAREGGLQHLRFTKTFNTIGNPGEIGGKNNLTYHVGSDSVLNPLKQWMKKHTDKQEGGTGEDKTINDCFPRR